LGVEVTLMAVEDSFIWVDIQLLFAINAIDAINTHLRRSCSLYLMMLMYVRFPVKKLPNSPKHASLDHKPSFSRESPSHTRRLPPVPDQRHDHRHHRLASLQD